MLTLLIKDFKLMFAKEKSAVKRFFGILLAIAAAAVMVAVETFLFVAILERLKNFSNAPRAFMVVFLVVISVLMSVSGVFQAKKLFFNEKDIQQLSIHPVSNSIQVLSKLVFLFFVHFATSFMFVFPLFVSYGVIFGGTMMFYYSAIFYPALSFVFEIGIALVFVYPVWYLLEYLKKHVLIEFIVSVVILFLLSWGYASILSVFVDLVANNELTSLFSADSIAALLDFEKYAVPINFLADIFIDGRESSIFPYLAIAGGIFMLGLIITIFTFHRVRNVSVDIKPAELKMQYKPRSVTYGLVKKELALITRNPDYIYSFSGLLIVQPLLLYLIITAMNAIFGSGTFLYYTTLFPNFVSIVDVFLVMMVTVIISAGANQYIAMEERTVKNLKTIPVSFRHQIYVKISIPFILSEASLIISLLVLMITGTFSPITTLFAFLLSTVLLFVFDVISLCEELQIRHGKPRKTLMSSVFSYVLPIAYMAVSIYLSYVGADLWLLYLSGIGVFLLLGLPYVLITNHKLEDWFMDLEAIN